MCTLVSPQWEKNVEAFDSSERVRIARRDRVSGGGAYDRARLRPAARIGGSKWRLQRLLRASISQHPGRTSSDVACRLTTRRGHSLLTSVSETRNIQRINRCEPAVECKFLPVGLFSGTSITSSLPPYRLTKRLTLSVSRLLCSNPVFLRSTDPVSIPVWIRVQTSSEQLHRLQGSTTKATTQLRLIFVVI